jgi:hypothetical protein
MIYPEEKPGTAEGRCQETSAHFVVFFFAEFLKRERTGEDSFWDYIRG